MSVLNFIAQMGIAKAGGIAEGFAGALARFDPETASKVDIDNLQASFEKFGNLVAKAEPEEARTHKLVTDLETKLERTKTAATILSGQIDTAAGDTTKVMALNNQLTALVGAIEEIGGETGDGNVSGSLFDARQDHTLAESDLHELQTLHQGAATSLSQARNNLARAQADMARAARTEATNKEREDRAKEVAGLKTGLSGNSIALQAMQAQAAKLKEQSRAHVLNAQALTGVSAAAATTDDIVAQTLAGAPTESAQDRLARMLGKKAAA